MSLFGFIAVVFLAVGNPWMAVAFAFLAMIEYSEDT